MMKLVAPTDPVLTTPCEEFDFLNPPFDPSEFAVEMVKFMIDSNGIGLAANQMGVPYRIFSMRASPENFCCFNPRIVMASTEKVLLEEACLTFPGLIVKLKRPQHVKVRFQLPNGDTLTKQFTGMSARVFQHELDHLNGVLFYNNASRYHREFAFRHWKKSKE